MNPTQKTIATLFSVLFGLFFSFIGFVNLFWGNDTLFGLFLLLLSLIYYPPIQRLMEQKMHFRIPGMAKILLGIFILWASLGVGELFDKIELMVK